MKRIRKFLASDEGNILAFIAVGIMTILLAASLSIDVGSAVTARNELQAAVDAAALAGASGLISSQSYSRQLAGYFASRNTVHNQTVGLAAGDITFPASSRIRVVGHFNAPPFFVRVAGINNLPIQATAEAQLASIIGTPGLRPFFIPDMNWEVGKPVIIKIGDPNVTKDISSPGFFFATDYPPVNRGDPISGANAFEDNIANGADGMVYINDVLQLEPGNMTGPTQQGIASVLAEDPGAYWNTSTNMVSGSKFPGAESPRIIKVPFFDSKIDLKKVGKQIPVTGLAAFFLEGINGKDVYGRFMNLVTGGETGQGNTMLYKPLLIQ